MFSSVLLFLNIIPWCVNCQVDKQSLEGFNNQQALDVLRGTGQTVRLKMARYPVGAHFEPVSRRSGISPAHILTSSVETVENDSVLLCPC